MSTLLTQYFERYSEDAIAKMKEAILAVSFYERIKLRLVKKEDLSVELPTIAKVGPAGTMAVVRQAISDYKVAIEFIQNFNKLLDMYIF